MKFNNAKAKKIRDVIKGTVNQTVKNMSILEHFFHRAEHIVTGVELETAGFIHQKATDRAKSSSGNFDIPIYHIYQLINLSENKFKIEKL